VDLGIQYREEKVEVIKKTTQLSVIVMHSIIIDQTENQKFSKTSPVFIVAQ
jgi:hypothetical protein